MPPSENGPPRAIIEHALPGRLRIRVPARRGDRAYFARAEAALSRSALVVRTSANPATAGLLLTHHAADIEPIAALAHEQGLFELQIGVALPVRHLPRSPVQPPSALAWAAAGFAGLGTIQALRGRFHGNAMESLWNAYLQARLGMPVLAAGLAALGAMQLVGGRVLGSGVSLFIYGATAARMARPPARGPT